MQAIYNTALSRILLPQKPMISNVVQGYISTSSYQIQITISSPSVFVLESCGRSFTGGIWKLYTRATENYFVLYGPAEL